MRFTVVPDNLNDFTFMVTDAVGHLGPHYDPLAK
jgi:hypothetical protein